jgi:hypothetical protein
MCLGSTCPAACHRWPSQHHRPRARRWHRHDLGRDLDGERKRRPRRRSEQVGHDYRHLGVHRSGDDRKLHNGSNGGFRRSPPRRFVHARDRRIAMKPTGLLPGWTGRTLSSPGTVACCGRLGWTVQRLHGVTHFVVRFATVLPVYPAGLRRSHQRLHGPTRARATLEG